MEEAKVAQTALPALAPSPEVPSRAAVADPPNEGLPPSDLSTTLSVCSIPLEENSSKVGARLLDFWPAWQSLGANDWVVSVLRWGYNLEFAEPPPLSNSPTIFSDRKDPAKNDIIWGQIQILLQKGALEEVRAPHSPGFYGLLFVVPKPDGTWRPIIDLSILNLYLEKKKFKMETPKSICAMLHKGAWTFSIDLTDAYFHIPIHPRSKKYMRLAFRNKIFQFRALPFGIASAPWLFTKIMKPVKLGVDFSRLTLFQYLDDWLGECQSQQSCAEEAARLVSLCHTLGLIINLKKSELTPTQIFDFIGIHFDLVLGTLSPTNANVEKVLSSVARFLSQPLQTARDWESLIGILGSQDRLIPWGRFHLRRIQLAFQDRWRPSTGQQSDLVPVPESLKSHLAWWSLRVNLVKGVPLEPPLFDVKLFTDASTQGWGAHLEDESAQGVWSIHEQSLHINLLEMRAVRLSLLHFQVPPHSNILVASDNSTVVAYINKQGGTRSRPLWLETLPLLELAIQKKWQLRARHIPGRLNVIADQLSRAGQLLPTEWSLHPDVAHWIFQHLGVPLVDLFATRYNNKLPLFVSPVPDPRALDTDALSMSWENLMAYAFPPHQILPQVLQKIRLTKSCSVILVAPLWPNQSWFPALIELADPDPLPLPLWPSLLKQPRTNQFHWNPALLKLHAWKLVRSPSRQPAFLKGLEIA